ncbi:MAG: NUDIX domain-containing protein [Chloroflexota bacterium]
MTFDISIYRIGYSIGVGGVVLCGNKALLIRRALGDHIGAWTIPSGFVERDETIDTAVKREIHEEAGVEAELAGLIGVRSRFAEDENSAYFIFLLHAEGEQSQADGYEVDRARFFTLEEIEELPHLQALSKIAITKALRGEAKVLQFQAHPEQSLEEYVIYI